MKKLLIYGCGYPSMPSLIKYWNTIKDQQWDVVGYIDDVKFKKVDDFFGYSVVGNEQSIPKFVKEGYYFFNNVVSSTDKMEVVAQKLLKYKAKICTLVFTEPPNIHYEKVFVGEGSCVFPGVFVGTDVHIGKNVIVRQQANISHDTEIGDLCFVGPGAGIMGNVKVGNNTFIGAKALIRNDITIGRNCVVGMGAVVTKDVPDNTTVVGIPAKPIHTKRGNNTTLKSPTEKLFITNI